MFARELVYSLGAFLLLTGCAEDKPKDSRRSPEECVAALVKASNNADDRAALACYSPGWQNVFVGWAAYYVEQEVFLKTKQHDAALKVLRDFDLEDMDIVGDLQISESLGLQRVGTRIEDKAGFLKAAREIIERNDSILNFEAKAGGRAKEFDLLGLRVGPDAMVKEVEIKRELATGKVFETKSDEPRDIVFRKFADGWVIGFEKEPLPLPRFTKAQLAAVERLSKKWDLGCDKNEPVRGFTSATLTYSGDRAEDIRLLALFPSLEEVTIRECGLSSEDLKSICGLPRLRRLILTNSAIPNESVSHILRMTNLESLVVVNSGLSDDSIAKLREGLKTTKIEAGYRTVMTLGFEEKNRQDRNQSGMTVLVYVHAESPLREDDPVFDNVLNDAGVAQLIWQNKVECMIVETKPDGTVGEFDKADWLAEPAYPQVAIFAPKSKTPVILSGDKLNKEELLKALRIAGPSQKEKKSGEVK